MNQTKIDLLKKIAIPLIVATVLAGLAWAIGPEVFVSVILQPIVWIVLSVVFVMIVGKLLFGARFFVLTKKKSNGSEDSKSK